MFKKVIPIVLSLCLIFSISVVAENDGAANDSGTPEAVREMPMQAGERPQGTPPQMPNGERPRGGNRGGQMPQGEFTPPQINETNNIPQSENNQDVNTASENEAEKNTQNPDNTNGGNGQQSRQFPEGMQGGFSRKMGNDAQNAQTQQSTGFIGFVKTYSTPITSVVLLGLAFIFVIFYRRKNY